MTRLRLLRAVANRAMIWAERLLPRERSSWGAAMRAEFEHVKADSAALAWAVGCLLASWGFRAREIVVKREATASFAISLVFGTAIWAISPIVTGHAELWDSSSAFYIVALVMTGLIVGWLCPRKISPILPGVAVGQFVYMLLFLPKGPLIVVGFVALFVYGLLAIGAAFVSSRLKRVWLQFAGTNTL